MTSNMDNQWLNSAKVVSDHGKAVSERRAHSKNINFFEVGAAGVKGAVAAKILFGRRGKK